MIYRKDFYFIFLDGCKKHENSPLSIHIYIKKIQKLSLEHGIFSQVISIQHKKFVEEDDNFLKTETILF